jgi:homoserine O-acetyltransferase
MPTIWLTLLRTWYDGNTAESPAYGGDFDLALRAIKARTVIMPGQHDSYFPAVGSDYDASKIPNAVWPARSRRSGAT